MKLICLSNGHFALIRKHSWDCLFLSRIGLFNTKYFLAASLPFFCQLKCLCNKRVKGPVSREAKEPARKDVHYIILSACV